MEKIHDTVAVELLVALRTRKDAAAPSHTSAAWIHLCKWSLWRLHLRSCSTSLRIPQCMPSFASFFTSQIRLSSVFLSVSRRFRFPSSSSSSCCWKIHLLPHLSGFLRSIWNKERRRFVGLSFFAADGRVFCCLKTRILLERRTEGNRRLHFHQVYNRNLCIPPCCCSNGYKICLSKEFLLSLKPKMIIDCFSRMFAIFPS